MQNHRSGFGQAQHRAHDQSFFLGEAYDPRADAARRIERALARLLGDEFDTADETETACLVSSYRCMPVRPGSMGKPPRPSKMNVLTSPVKRTAQSGRSCASAGAGMVEIITSESSLGDCL